MKTGLIVRALLPSLLALLTASCALLPNASCNVAETLALPAALPANAEVIETRCDRFSYSISFTIAAEDLAGFQERTPIRDWQPETRSAIFAEPPFAAEAARASSYVYGEYSDGAYLVYALVDTSDAQRNTVYYRSNFVD